MMPDFPMPVTMTRPRQWCRRSTARSKRPSSRGTSARIAAASVRRTLRASSRSAIDTSLFALDHGVKRGQALKERLEQIEAQGILCVALGVRRILVDFQEHAVDARGNAGGRERLDVLRET